VAAFWEIKGSAARDNRVAFQPEAA
jgi:hypothetical protein